MVVTISYSADSNGNSDGSNGNSADSDLISTIVLLKISWILQWRVLH